MKFKIGAHNMFIGGTDTGNHCLKGSDFVVDSSREKTRFVLGRYTLPECPFCEAKNLDLTEVLEVREDQKMVL